jgi:hypothetical protein
VGIKWIFLSLKIISPFCKFTKLLIVFKIVLLPDPLGPIKATVSPLSTCRETFQIT